MKNETALTLYTGSALDIVVGDVIWDLEQCVKEWIDTKHDHSHSGETKSAYQDTLASFRAALQSQGLDLDADRAVIAPRADEWAGTSLRANHEVAPTTFNQRIAIVSSFYKFAVKHEVLSFNPIERVERRKVGKKDAARPLKPSQVKSGLQKIDQTTLEGLRDYALLSVALTTGHRASEIANLRMKHLRKQDDETCVIEFEHCKGNEYMTAVLKAKTTTALYTYLYAVYGASILTVSGDMPVWVSFSKRNAHQAIGARTISNMCKDFLGTSKVHVTRHTAALEMMNRKASLEEIRKFLGHKNAATTSIYLDDMTAYQNRLGDELEEAFGI